MHKGGTLIKRAIGWMLGTKEWEQADEYQEEQERTIENQDLQETKTSTNHSWKQDN